MMTMQMAGRAKLKSLVLRLTRRNATFARSGEPKKGDKVVVGMSGGVDSSVSAALLASKMKDYDLSAVFMRNWDTRDESGTDKGCEWEKDWEDVQRVCRTLDLPCTMVDLTREYWNRVFEPSLKLWEMGVTPNPDVLCNKEIKFGALLGHMPSSIPSDAWFATGHYAQKDWMNGRPVLKRAADRAKDQNYYLASISEGSLARSMFPIGHLLKSEVRELAKRFALPTAERPESMGICFIGEKTKFSSWISQYLQPQPGNILDLASGKKLGSHQGLWQYTIGENARIGGLPERMFVAKKDIKQNTIYVTLAGGEALYTNQMKVVQFQPIWADIPPPPIARLQHRHRMHDIECNVERVPDSNELWLTFEEPQRGVCPGQAAVIWDGDRCLGTGTIVDSDT